jgi:hypothetical protein
MDSWFGAILGGAVYGAWATWANWGDGPHQALRVGAVHWATSAALTFGGTWFMRRLHLLLPASTGWRSALRTSILGLCLTYAVLLLVHLAIQTQHILLTLAPGLIPNILFCSSYAALLVRTQKVTP